MAPWEAAPLMIGLGTLGSWKYGINISRNLLLSVVLHLLWILLLCNSKWVCPCTIRYGGLRMETLLLVSMGIHWLECSLALTASGCYVPVSGECSRKRQNLPTITWQPRTLVREHLMARRLPFLALSSPTLRGCPWRALLWPYAGATRTSKQGTPLKGKDALLRASVPLLTRIPSTEGYQCRSRQGYYPQRSISATISKDTIHRDVSVLSQARMLPQKHQCFPATTLEQGCSD